jgi:hypothetical protein
LHCATVETVEVAVEEADVVPVDVAVDVAVVPGHSPTPWCTQVAGQASINVPTVVSSGKVMMAVLKHSRSQCQPGTVFRPMVAK